MDQEQMMKMMIEGNYGPLPGADSAAVCRQGADEGIVLLKNEGVLPIAEEKIALFGAGAVDTIVCGTGSGSVFPPYVINVEQGLTEGGYTITSRKWLDKFAAAGKKANDEADINVIDRYWSGITILIDEPEVTDEEIEEAREASVAIYVIRRNTGEGFDRKNEKGDFLLSDMERANLEKIAAAFDQTIVVFNTTVMDPRFTEEIDGIDGVIYMGLLGMEAGRALCDIISGKVCPSGRLTDTWAKKYEDYPASATFSANDGDTQQENYNEDIYVGYRYFDSFGIEPFYPFGYGLSYTEFELETVEITAGTEEIRVHVRVTNTGEVAGKEVVQVYISAPQGGKLPQPYQELRGFVKTGELEPGDSENVEIVIPTESLASFDEERAAYVMEAGDYLVRVGKNSRDTEVEAVLRLSGEVVTQQVSNLVACDRELDIIKAPVITYEYDSLRTPVILLAADSFHTEDLRPKTADKTVTYVPEGSDYTSYITENPYKLPYPCPEEIVKVRAVPDATLLDVKEGKVTLEEFVASLDTGVLLRLVTGIANETPHPVENRMKKKVSFTKAPTSSGQTTGQYVETLGIPNSYMTDGPAGLHIIGFPTAGWPVGIPLAQTWNLDILEKVGDGFGIEMTVYHQTVVLGPGMNIHRDPLCGRCFEYYSEDPLVSGKCAAAFTKGVQSHRGCKVSIKHFACNDQELDRATSNSSVSQRALREIYLKGFEIAVRESQPGTIMTSYNCINGRHSSENKELLEHIVRGEWGFEGLFMTDWGSQSYKPSDMHAGNDLIMGGLQVEYFESALYGTDPVFTEDGSVDEIVNMAYGGMMRQAVENWGAFLPQAGGKDSYTVTVAAGTELGERAQKRVEEGSATVTENADGTKTVTYHGIKRGRHLPLGDVQRCAMDVLKYLMSSLAWDDMMASMEEQEKA